ncbi:site-specific integrase [Castellaniella ginsengisoli]|uniref:Site-specific integrase n=1 Tax=Castellaniella ginsengisoli TaxID=546114 RepID=A0AB39ESR6_9BURK
MSIYYDKKRRRYRFEFDRVVHGNRVRGTKLLPQTWTQAQADKFDREESGRLYAIAQGVEQNIPTIDVAVVHYLKAKQGLKSHMQAAQHLNAVLPWYEGRRLNELPDVAQAITDDKTGAWKAATIKQRIALLRAACRLIWRDRRLQIPDPAGHLALPEVNNARQEYATRLEVLRMCRAIPKREARRIILIAFYSGMRRGEIWGAEVAGGNFVLTDTKNGDPRIVPIVGKVACYARKLPPDISYRSLMIWLKKGAAAIGRPGLRLHDLRHSAASGMVQAGVPLYTVGKVLGHKSQASTARYSHLGTQDLHNALAAIGKKSVGKS